MATDGRGLTIPPVGIVARLWAWLRARPLLVLVGSLLAGLGVATAQTRYYRTKANRNQKAADIASGKARQAASRIVEDAARTSVQKADQDAQEAAGRDKAAGDVVTGASDDLEAVERRWKARPRWPTQ